MRVEAAAGRAGAIDSSDDVNGRVRFRFRKHGGSGRGITITGSKA